MNLDYAVDRLYDSGWFPVFGEEQYEQSSDGRSYPSVAAVQREFENRGLQLVIKHNLMYNCHRATWAPQEESIDATAKDERHGTVIGSSEHEAAVFALAQLRESQGVVRVAMA